MMYESDLILHIEAAVAVVCPDVLHKLTWNGIGYAYTHALKHKNKELHGYAYSQAFAKDAAEVIDTFRLPSLQALVS